MTKKIVTTMGPGGWETCGRRFVESFKAFWPQDILLEVWHHDLDEVPAYPGVSFRSLNELPAYMQITANLQANSETAKSNNFHFKVVALAAAVDTSLDWIAGLDLDVETFQPVDDELLDQIFDPKFHLTYLYRKANQKSEGSWVAFNLREPEGCSLLSDYYGLYASMEFLHYKNPHDNAVLDRLVTIHKAHNLKVKNLSAGALGLDAFHQSPLAGYMVHYKGPDKNRISDPSLGVPSRYQTLCEVLAHCVRETNYAKIVEVGTWNGSRAVQMAEAAFAAGMREVTYVGFDTFDDGTERAKESHEKPDASLRTVDARLANYAKVVARQGKTFRHHLVKGNTLVTLPASGDLTKGANFAYIDGGHSYETVKSDYACLADTPCVVFDDVIKSDNPAASAGPRKVFEEVTLPKHLALSSDRQFIGGLPVGEIALGVVFKPPLRPFSFRTRLQVKPVDSVDKSEQFEHIAQNSAAISTWLKAYQAHLRTALLVSAGPTLPAYLEEIKAKQATGAVVFAVKHAYPTLKAAGIQPDFVVVLDPRPVDGLSTHGVLRSSLFESMGPADKVLFATMTHPSARLAIERSGATILGWHAHTMSVQNADLPQLKEGLVINGGTCSATRMPMLAFTMGFRRFEFYGYDFFYPAETKQEDLKQSLMKVQVGEDGKEFLTTGELVAAMQDLDQWNRWLIANQISVKFHGEGAGAHIWQSTVKRYKQPEEYEF